MNDIGLTFDPDTHRYWHSECELPSVTTVLKSLKLTPYYPPSEESKSAMVLGTRVHSATQRHDEGKPIGLSASDPVISYLSTWTDFLQHFGGTVIDCELKVMSNRHRFAGTLDRVFRKSDGSLVILDIKTGSGGRQSWHLLQLAAYQIAYEESGFNPNRLPITRSVCYLSPDRWRVEESSDDQDLQAFKAAMCLFYWRRWNR